MEHQYEDEMEIDLKELLFAFKKKLWLILLAAILGSGIAGALSALVMKPQYTSSSMLYVLSKETTLTSLADLQIGTQLTNDYRVLVSSRPVLEVVIEELGLDMSYETLTGEACDQQSSGHPDFDSYGNGRGSGDGQDHRGRHYGSGIGIHRRYHGDGSAEGD